MSPRLVGTPSSAFSACSPRSCYPRPHCISSGRVGHLSRRTPPRRDRPPPASPASVRPARPDSLPTMSDLNDLPTEELRRQAFAIAEHRHDVGFFWDLLRHLPRTADAAAEDASGGGIGESIADLIGVVRQLSGKGYGDAEPLVRAKFLDYLRTTQP